MPLYGWVGKIAWIDLSKGTIESDGIEEYCEWIGGRGLASHLLLENMPVNADPFSPENLIIISTGPLTGTLSPSSGRLNISTKNALTHGYASANGGGYFAPELKMAGLDAVIIRGVAKTPVYIFIYEGKVKILPAEKIWGLTTSKCYRALKDELSDEEIRILCIGPGGENRCKIANVVVDNGRSASYGGIGAVFGAKKLKAIAVKGSLPISVFNTKQLTDLARVLFRKIMQSTPTQQLKNYGTLLTSPPGLSGKEAHVVRNYQDGIWEPDKTIKLNPLVFIEQHKVMDLSCFNCPVQCSKLYRYSVGLEGEDIFEGLQANHITNFGSMIDNDDPQVILQASALCNDLGLDVDSAACGISWAFECFQREKLSVSDCDGLHLNWGNKDAIIPIIKRMAYRKGLGDLLADGPLEAARNLGNETEHWAMNIKGAPLREINMQTKMSWALGIGVSTRGSGHLNGAVRFESFAQLSSKDLEILGFEKLPDASDAEDIGRVVAWFEDFKSLVDSLGVCYLATWWVGGPLGPSELAELYDAVTGKHLSARELLNRGACIQNLEKAFNTLHAGFTRKDDLPPERLFAIPISRGKNKGAVIRKDFWKASLNEYYRARKYNLESGLQTRACLRDLSLQNVERRLQAVDKLI